MSNKLNVYCRSTFLIFISIFFLNSIVKAQSCGFGCLGLSGIYGGYSLHEYDAAGLNNYINSINVPNSEIEFNKAEGFRVGGNLFRAQFDNYFFSVKGFFQFLNEEHEFSATTQNDEHKERYKLSHNYWGIGADFGIPLFSIIDWKIIEGGVTFFNINLKETEYSNNIQIYERKIENSKADIGYYVGSGVIINIIEDYISLEGSANYNIYEIKDLSSDDGGDVALNNDSNFIKNKGISLTVQLNIGFPL